MLLLSPCHQVSNQRLEGFLNEAAEHNESKPKADPNTVASPLKEEVDSRSLSSERRS